MEDDMNKTKSMFNARWLFQKVKNVSYNNIVLYMYQPCDPSSLGVIRFLFGLLMMIDLHEERGGADIDMRWGESKYCHFPLFSFLMVPSFPYMALLYCAMWFGALGIMLGYKFHLSTLVFSGTYWYILLLDKSFWNNHSYLFGLVSILLIGTSANHYLSIDSYLDPSKKNTHIPFWNYFILKYQFFILYFFAGLKKTDSEWLEGYSMSDLGCHWVFLPFQYFLSFEKIDYFIVHWFGFLLDLTIAFWMWLEFTRPIAMVFCAMFHLMNSRLFSIGMFPYVCLVTMPLFCEENWPKKLKKLFTKNPLEGSLPSKKCIYKNDGKTFVKWKHTFSVALLIAYCLLQIFLPYSHFITKGYNNWTNGLYGYSWDMMVHSWETVAVVVKVVDNDIDEEYFVDPSAFTFNGRWNKHADMCLQYAHCLKENVKRDMKESQRPNYSATKSTPDNNISIYVDVWCSLNKRFQQRMFNPNYDLLKANWSPFKRVEWLLPILSEYNDLRTTMDRIMQAVYSWSNNSDVLFIADFPGMTLENYIEKDLSNVTLTVLEGEVAYEIEDKFLLQSLGVKLKKGDMIPIEVGFLHKIHTISETPSCYMYTYVRANVIEDDIEKTAFPLYEDTAMRVREFFRMWEHIFSSISHLLFNTPCHIRSKITKKL